jgi:hypothetical protein
MVEDVQHGRAEAKLGQIAVKRALTGEFES